MSVDEDELVVVAGVSEEGHGEDEEKPEGGAAGRSVGPGDATAEPKGYARLVLPDGRELRIRGMSFKLSSKAFDLPAGFPLPMKGEALCGSWTGVAGKWEIEPDGEATVAVKVDFASVIRPQPSLFEQQADPRPSEGPSLQKLIAEHVATCEECRTAAPGAGCDVYVQIVADFEGAEEPTEEWHRWQCSRCGHQNPRAAANCFGPRCGKLYDPDEDYRLDAVLSEAGKDA